MVEGQRQAGAALRRQDRYAYSALQRRAPFRWPNGARMAVYFALGIEDYSFGEGMTENLVPGVPAPDVLNASWRDYGNRIGAWRLLDAFGQYKLPLSILLNTVLCKTAPDLVAACNSAGCEFIAHGYSNSDILTGLTEAQESAYLSRIARQIQEVTGRPPAGWSSPWIAETPLTPDLLQETGYEYLLDFCMDDQPVWLRTRRGRILSVPYSLEVNDSSAMIGRHVGPEEFASMIIDQFEEMRRGTPDHAVVMSVVVHSFISGQPFRLRPLRRALEHIANSGEPLWLAQPAAIARHFRSLE
jgi:peptidoglycan/xylan/chitin deacetylase (PgdA/CDA1 family)